MRCTRNLHSNLQVSRRNFNLCFPLGLRAAKSEDYLAGAHHSPARPHHLQDDDRRQQRGHRRKEDARINRQDEWPPMQQQQQQRRPQQQQLQQHSRRSQPKQQLRGASSEADLLHQSRFQSNSIYQNL